jgi:hypothetical protein
LHGPLHNQSAGAPCKFSQFFEGLFRLKRAGAPRAGARFPIQSDQDRPLGYDVTECRLYASVASA